MPHNLDEASESLGLAGSGMSGAGLRRSKAERAFIVIFCVLQLVVPPWLIDFYPFTTMPMYSDSLRRISLFSIVDSEGESLSLVDFQLQSNYLANRSARIGRQQPPTLNSVDEIVSDDSLVQHVRDRLQSHPCVKAVNVTQKIYGPLQRGARATVGVLEQKSWVIANQAYACGEKQ